MPSDSAFLCRLANRFFARPPMSWVFRVPAPGPRGAARAYVEWEFDQAARTVSLFGDLGNPRSRKVLDVGCAFGGKSAYLAQNGASHVTGIDIDHDRIAAAADFAAGLRLQNASFEVADIISYDPGSTRFDMILLVDVIEHVADPLAALRNCNRLLNQGGRALVSFPPYGSPWGSHLIPQISIPWAPALFTDRALLSVWKETFNCQASSQGALSDGKRRALSECASVREIWGLNGLTIRQFEESLKQVPFRLLTTDPHALWSLPGVARLLWLRERLVTRYLVVLEKT